MEKVSAKTFFTTMWRGLCQALGWFFGLFGYNRNGKFAKCVWGLFAVSAAIVMAFLAFAIVTICLEKHYYQYMAKHHCYDNACHYVGYVSENVRFHNMYDGKGYVFNIATGKKTIKDVEWKAGPMKGDSLVCYSDGKKRGYFNKNTGKMVIEPKYDHAWIFSGGLAAVDYAGTIKFIDQTGKIIFDTQVTYRPYDEGYVFHDGYCIVPAADGEHWRLIDTAGKAVLPMDYDIICSTFEENLWQVTKDSMEGVFGKDLTPILPLMECSSVYVANGTIDVTMTDHTIRKYDLKGKLINDFYINSVRMLEYEKDEIVNQVEKTNPNEDSETVEVLETSFHPKATARLRAYVAGNGYEGLMTADGQLVTMPIYSDIEAIGQDLYLCTTTNCDKLIVNGRGEIVWNK